MLNPTVLTQDVHNMAYKAKWFHLVAAIALLKRSGPSRKSDDCMTSIQIINAHMKYLGMYTGPHYEHTIDEIRTMEHRQRWFHLAYSFSMLDQHKRNKESSLYTIPLHNINQHVLLYSSFSVVI